MKMSSHLDLHPHPPSPLPTAKKPTYDLTPFHSSSAIPDAPTSLPIPESLIASPLAANLAPASLIDIRRLLTGGISSSDQGGSGVREGAGEEIWRAWKRAWDLWNGFFVEGRVNEGFLRGEYERVRAELEGERGRERECAWDGENRIEVEVGIEGEFVRPVERGTPPVPRLKGPEEVVMGDGSTGGFMPMKLLPEYRAPAMDEAGAYPEGWEDVLANSVWRPRRVGEREGEVSVGIDGEWGEKSEFEFDGGVDCGRSPYPCLRYVVEHVRRDGCFLKKKVWDGVTGTIFNMPTSPASPSSPTISDKQRRISNLYGDFYRDKVPQHRNPEYFPLDIRRVDIIDRETGKKHPATPLLESGEELVRWPWNNPEGSFVQLDSSDPWCVTDEQQEKQLVPPRRYPPGKAPSADGDTLLPTDDTIWREEIENDANFRSQYFVTNLHGGTLVVNGLEVKLGQIAGPLPEFAIIETPGNQISFWFGPQGRDWRGLQDDTLYTSQWKTLRRNPGWENVGLTAGQVWDVRIRDRLRREYKGEEGDDDAQWAEWKTAVVKQKPILEKISPLDIVIWDGRPGPSPAHCKQAPEAAQPEFSTELEELQWLLTKAYPLKDVTPTLERENIIMPPPSALWPGPNTPERPDIVNQAYAQKIWDKRREGILQQQRDMNASLAQQRAARALEKKQKIDGENRKRKAASSQGPAAKKARHDDPAQRRANAQAEYEDMQDELQEDWERKREIWDNDSAELEKIANDAAIAAKTREELKTQAPRLSLLSDRQREKEEQRVKDQVKCHHAVQKRKEQELRNARILEANKERAEKGLQLLPELSPYPSEEEKQQRANKTRKVAQKKDEERQKQAELEKNRQKAGKRGKGAQNEQKEAATALKNTTGSAKDDATALAKRVADALAAENEQKRLQFIADRETARKAERERKAKEAAAEAARAEMARRAYLFQDKYGVLPAASFRLDASGKPEFGQGFEPPREPSFKILSPDDLERMTEGEWIEYAKLLSMQTATQLGNSATNEKPVDLLNMSYDQQIARATKQSLGINGSKDLKDEKTRKLLIENVKSLLMEQSARIRLELKAKIEGISAEQYAINHNFKSAADYISSDTDPLDPENLPQVKDNNLPANVLQMSRYWIQHHAQTGLQIRATREGKSMDTLAQEKGYSNLEEYLHALSASISIDDIPAIPKIQTQQDKEKWEALCQRILDAGEWESRVRYLPEPRTLRPLADKGQKRFIVL